MKTLTLCAIVKSAKSTNIIMRIQDATKLLAWPIECTVLHITEASKHLDKNLE